MDGIISNEELLKAIDILIKKRISQLNYNENKTGKIISRKYINNIFVYSVLIDGVKYEITDEVEYSVGTKVYISVPNRDVSHQYIIGSCSDISVVNRLPMATSSTLGGIKVGKGLTINSDGKLNTKGSDVYIKGINEEVIDNDLDFKWTNIIPQKNEYKEDTNLFSLENIKDNITFYHTLYDDYALNQYKGEISHGCTKDEYDKSFSLSYSNYNYNQTKLTLENLTSSYLHGNEKIKAMGNGCYTVSKINISNVKRNEDGSLYLSYGNFFYGSNNNHFFSRNKGCIAIFDGDCTLTPSIEKKWNYAYTLLPITEDLCITGSNPPTYSIKTKIVYDNYAEGCYNQTWNGTVVPMCYWLSGECGEYSQTTSVDGIGDWKVGTTINDATYDLNYYWKLGTGYKINENINMYNNVLYYRCHEQNEDNGIGTKYYCNGLEKDIKDNEPIKIYPTSDCITVVFVFDCLDGVLTDDSVELDNNGLLYKNNNIKWGNEYSEQKSFKLLLEAGALTIHPLNSWFANIFIGVSENHEKWEQGIEEINMSAIPEQKVAGKIYDSSNNEFKLDSNIYYQPIDEEDFKEDDE